MKVIINSKSHDMERAALVAQGNNGTRNEELYCTDECRYFICNHEGRFVDVSENGDIGKGSEHGTIVQWMADMHITSMDVHEKCCLVPLLRIMGFKINKEGK